VILYPILSILEKRKILEKEKNRRIDKDILCLFEIRAQILSSSAVQGCGNRQAPSTWRPVQRHVYRTCPRHRLEGRLCRCLRPCSTSICVELCLRYYDMPCRRRGGSQCDKSCCNAQFNEYNIPLTHLRARKKSSSPLAIRTAPHLRGNGQLCPSLVRKVPVRSFLKLNGSTEKMKVSNFDIVLRFHIARWLLIMCFFHTRLTIMY
jgi:hypothetical protein